MNLSIKLTQLNGLVGDIFGYLGNWASNFFGAIFGGLFMTIYQVLIVPLFLIADAIQMMFKKFVGLDTYYVDGQSQSGDIVLSLINSQTVQNVFWALLILGVVLLIICTIISLIRAETQSIDDKNRKSKSKIFSDAIRALFNFFMVPVVAILGIFMGNALLKSLDEATSGGSFNRISTIVFKASAYDCNRARLYEKFALDIRDNDMNSMGVLKGSDQEEIAVAIDSAFANFTSFTPQSIIWENRNMFTEDEVYAHLLTLQVFVPGTVYIYRSCFSIYDAQQVYYYYDLNSFNFILCLIGIFFIIYVLFITSIGLIKRMFKLTILLIVSPPIVAISPLDNGTALGKWKKQFLGSTLSAYSTVVSLNLVFLLLGPISSIEFFHGVIFGMNLPFLNNLTNLLITVAALLFFKDFTKSLADLIGAEDAYVDGGSAAGSLAKKVGTTMSLAKGVIGGGSASQRAKSADEDVKKTQGELDQLKKDNKDGKNNQKIKDKEAELAKQQETSKGFHDEAAARFKQARESFASLATNGLSDATLKDYGDRSKEADGIANKNAAATQAYKDAKRQKKEVKKDAKRRWKEKKNQEFTENHPNWARVNRGFVNFGKTVGGVAKWGALGLGSLALGPLGGVVLGNVIGNERNKNKRKELEEMSKNEKLPETQRNYAREKLELERIEKEFGRKSLEYEAQEKKFKEAEKLENKRLEEIDEKRKLEEENKRKAKK